MYTSKGDHFWRMLYYGNTDKPLFGDKNDEQICFDPQGIAPIIQHWLRALHLSDIFPVSVRQIIIYFVLHFQFQVNNPIIASGADFTMHEFSAASTKAMFGTILFGKAFPSAATALFTYQCKVKLEKVDGLGIAVVPHDYNTFEHEHEYFPHHVPNTCVMLENGHFFGWNGQKQETAFKLEPNDIVTIEMSMKQKIMRLSTLQSKRVFVVDKLPHDSRLAFVLDGSSIRVIEQSWVL